MIGVTFKSETNFKPIAQAVDKAAFRTFSHAAAGIRKTAQAEFVKGPLLPKRKRKRRPKGSPKAKKTRQRMVPSAPGTPPHTRRRQMPNAITFDANKHGAVIGTRFSVAGTSGEAHEFGGQYKDNNYPERPFMGPALDANLTRFAADWQGSVY